jgi:hypothetical protein
MPERALRVETLQAGAPVVVGAVTLLPVERLVVQGVPGGASTWVSASKEPYALIVRDAAGMRAIGVDARPIPMESLRAGMRGLDAALARL